MAQQTAVDWLIEQIKRDQTQKALSATEWMQVIEQSKQMEKDQIVKAVYSCMGTLDGDGERYYEDEYGK